MRDPIRRAGKLGTVRVHTWGDTRIHTYISPADGLLANTQIVERPTKLIIFDAQYFLTYAAEAAAYASSLKKPVERIVLSHVHLDHWSGLPLLSSQFPEAPIYAPRGVAEYLRAHGQKILDARRPALGNRIPLRPIIPTHILPEGTEEIDGVRFDFLRFLDAESALQLVTIMPDQRCLFAFDLAFASNVHVFTVTSHFDNWIRILEELKTISTFELVLSGHGEPTDRSALDGTLAYLRTGKEMYAASKKPDIYASKMKAAFPHRQHANWIEISASLLYGVIDAYETEPKRE